MFNISFQVVHHTQSDSAIGPLACSLAAFTGTEELAIFTSFSHECIHRR